MQLLYFLEGLRTPLLSSALSVITELGGESALMLLGMTVFWCVDKYCGYYMLSMGFAGTAINQLLKLAFRIPRPWVIDEKFTIVESAREAATGYSFPSGHTQNVMATLGAPAVRTKQWAIRLLCIVGVVLTAFSRMYLGVHTPLDVCVSLAIGAVLLIVLYPVFCGADKKPKRALVVLAVIAVLALANVLWTELFCDPQSVDADNLASGLKNGYTVLGASLGMLVCFYLDSKYIHFRTAAFAWAQVLKVVFGGVIVIALRMILKQPLLAIFGGHNLSHAVRYFIMVMFAGAVWPLTFPWFARNCKVGEKQRRALKILLIVIICIVVLVGLLYFELTRNTTRPPIETETDNPFITPLGETMLSAHRAGGGEAAENTMQAFQKCVESDEFDIDIFEMDLRLTADGALVLLHDSTLDRTSDSAEIFGETDVTPRSKTLAQLKRLNMGETFEAPDGSRPYAGLRGDEVPDELRISTIDEVLDYLESRGDFRYIIEIKDAGEDGYLAADTLYRTLKRLNCLDKAVIGTFNNEVTAYMDSSYPDMLRSAGVNDVIEFYICSLLNLRKHDWHFVALQIPVDDYVLNLGTTRMVNYAHKNDIAVQYWTINDAVEMAYLRDIGADAIMTDVPETGSAILK